MNSESLNKIQKVITAFHSGNSDYFRGIYDSLYFDELKEIYAEISKTIKIKHSCSVLQVIEAFNCFMGSSEEIVLELGSHDGFLAQGCLKELPQIKTWYGMDIAPRKQTEMPDRYIPIVMHDHFYKMKHTPQCSIFISTHTLEHMSNKEAIFTLKHIKHLGIKKAIIELPFPINKSGSWNGEKSLHVLKGTESEIEYQLFNEWDIIYKSIGRRNDYVVWGLTTQ